MMAENAAMTRLGADLSRLLRNEWRDIASAPLDREIELAIIDGGITACGGSWLRHGDGWLDAETLRQVDVTATHWRYRRPVTPPISCC
jgi:hypothetical protein